MKPTFISLFAGIGGIDLGLERAGWHCVAQVEIDPYCRRVLAKHWPDVPWFEDVRTFGREQFDGAVDLIAGGFPCTDISSAGSRAGIRGEHSGLWSEFFRIICEFRPGGVLVENVAALLERGMGVVLGDLASIGYDAEWACLPLCSFGGPSIRDRVFIFAYPQGIGAGLVSAGPNDQGDGAIDANGSGATSSLRHPGDTKRGRLEGRIFRRADAPPKIAPPGRGTSLGTYLGEAWAPEPGENWLDDGLSGQLAQFSSRAFGNSASPVVVEWIGRRILAAMEVPA